jgi:hypothetical protein
MTPSMALRLARPASTADRGRFALIAGATALAGALLLAAWHILRLPAIEPGSPAEHDSGLANYVTEDGLRSGVIIAALLLTVPVFALAVQALRVGSVARDRRMASLRLAGATPQDVRTIAAAEAGAAAIAGGLLAGPAYLLLWLLVGVLPPGGARMLATPDVLDLPAWALVVPLAGIAGAFAGAAIHGRVIAEPLGVRRRAQPAAPGAANLATLVAGVALVLAGLVGLPLVARHGAGELGLIVTAIAGLLLAAFAGGPRLVLGHARVLGRRRGVEALLAHRRLRADPRTAGRVAGVLFVCGLALAVEVLLIAEQIFDSNFGDDTAFWVTGYGMTAVVVLVAAAVALLTLLVGAADGLLDARRPLATLGALGVDERMLERVVAVQLSATAVPAVVAGALISAPVVTVLGAFAGDAPSAIAVRVILPAAVTALAVALVMAAAARLAARLLRSLIRTAIDPENLRVA